MLLTSGDGPEGAERPRWELTVTLGRCCGWPGSTQRLQGQIQAAIHDVAVLARHFHGPPALGPLAETSRMALEVIEHMAGEFVDLGTPLELGWSRLLSALIVGGGHRPVRLLLREPVHPFQRPAQMGDLRLEDHLDLSQPVRGGSSSSAPVNR